MKLAKNVQVISSVQTTINVYARSRMEKIVGIVVPVVKFPLKVIKIILLLSVRNLRIQGIVSRC
jgi:hypothetical protein